MKKKTTKSTKRVARPARVVSAAPTAAMNEWKHSLTERTLMLLAIFFMVFAVFIVVMYQRQSDQVADIVKYEQMQRSRVVATPAPVTPKMKY